MMTIKTTDNRSEFGDSLWHHGIKGQKWGVRRFDYVKKGRRSSSKEDEKTGRVSKGSSENKSTNEELTQEELARRERLKKIAKYVAIGGGVALGAYGVYKLSSINSQQKEELLKKISAIDKNVTVRGWAKETQDKLQNKLYKYSELKGMASRLTWENYKKIDSNQWQMGYSKDQDLIKNLTSENKKLDVAKSRASLLATAADIMYSKSSNDLELYKQIDPTGETKTKAAAKAFDRTSKAVKEGVKKAVKEAPLTAAARKVEAEKAAVAANAVREIQKIKEADAKKIIRAYEKDPEKFLNGEMDIVNYFKYSNDKLNKLRKLAGLEIVPNID